MYVFLFSPTNLAYRKSKFVLTIIQRECFFSSSFFHAQKHVKKVIFSLSDDNPEWFSTAIFVSSKEVEFPSHHVSFWLLAFAFPVCEFIYSGCPTELNPKFIIILRSPDYFGPGRHEERAHVGRGDPKTIFDLHEVEYLRCVIACKKEHVKFFLSIYLSVCRGCREISNIV